MEELFSKEWYEKHLRGNDLEEPIIMAAGMLVDTDYCEMCDKPLGRKVSTCCDGSMCGCMGHPTEPPVCSDECYDAYMVELKVSFCIGEVGGFIDGFFHPAQRIILENEYYSTKSHNPHVIVAILKTVMDYRIEVDRHALIKAYINSEYLEVREACLELIEDLCDEESLYLLGQISEDPVKFLEEYKAKIKEQIEKKLNGQAPDQGSSSHFEGW